MADTDTTDAEAPQKQDLNASATSVGSKVARTHKPRTKGLLKKLQTQVEFYFGDANLPKDKFLKQKMAEDPHGYVPLSVVASFKKMKSLTEDSLLIVKAVKNSSMLELSDDLKGVRRATPLPDHTPSDVDVRTVYVENLPTRSTTHDTVKKLFKMFGEVTYVSLPRYKGSGNIKGFAFVEFSTVEGAESALLYFKDKSASTGEQSAVTSQGAESEATPTNRKRKREDSEQEVEESSTEQSESVAMVTTIADSTQTLTSTTDAERDSKKLHSDKPEGVSEGAADGVGVSLLVVKETGDTSEEEEPKRKRKRESDEEDTQPTTTCKLPRLDSQSSDTQEGGASDRGKKKRKKNRQHKKKSSSSVMKELDQLRVLAKTEWMSMKKIFKDLQKGHMHQLKEGQKSPQEKPKEGRGYVGECLVKVTCVDGASVERLQEVCSVYGEVAYIDIHDGDKEGFVRYRQSGCVTKLVQADHAPLTNVTFAPVPEEEERAYFLKTQAERKQRYLKGRKNKRGQDKLISKVLRRDKSSPGHPPTQVPPTRAPPPAAVERLPTKSKGTHIKFSDSDSEQ